MDHVITVGLLVAVIVAISFVAWRFFAQAQRLRARYSGMIDVDAGIAGARKTLEEVSRERERLEAETQERRSKLNGEYEQGLATYKLLKQEVSLLEENLEDISFGVYEPHFDFQAPEQYKLALEQLRDREQLAPNFSASACSQQQQRARSKSDKVYEPFGAADGTLFSTVTLGTEPATNARKRG
ncbi:MAG TPA: hypothetical protein VIN93_14745 [Bryobacteraceae bacterium]|jgi:hypothetical protein